MHRRGAFHQPGQWLLCEVFHLAARNIACLYGGVVSAAHTAAFPCAVPKAKAAAAKAVATHGPP